MTKRTAAALAAFFLLALPLASNGDSGHGHKAGGEKETSHHEEGEGHGTATPLAANLVDAWRGVMAARDAIAIDIGSGKLDGIHEKTELLSAMVAEVIKMSSGLDAEKLKRVEGAAKQVARIAGELHEAADGGDAAQSRKELSRLDGLLMLIRVQYPTGSLEADSHNEHGHGDHSAATKSAHGAHAHMEAPAGVVDAAPRVTVRIQALDRLLFEPSRIEVEAGVPTRIVLENVGAAEHSLVVKTPDGSQDWIHLHVPPGVTAEATYQFDLPGIYPVLCTIPGHAEGGMIGEFVVLAAHDTPHSRQ